MMTGMVTGGLEAMIDVTLQGAAGQLHQVEAVIDTGFIGYLTLPPALIAAMGFPWLRRQQCVLADGTVRDFDIYLATLVWDGQVRTVEAEAVDGKPLVGVWLPGTDLRIEFVNNGTVTITPRP